VALTLGLGFRASPIKQSITLQHFTPPPPFSLPRPQAIVQLVSVADIHNTLCRSIAIGSPVPTGSRLSCYISMNWIINASRSTLPPQGYTCVLSLPVLAASSSTTISADLFQGKWSICRRR
jgi:hypothetical protein